MSEALLQSVGELFGLMPDSILFGTMVLYFLTQNFTYAVFGVFILELIFGHRLLSSAFSSFSPTPTRLPGGRVQCRAGFKMPQLPIQRMFTHDPYPSYGVFSMTAIGTYLALATREFSGTMDEMDRTLNSNWGSRAIVAYSFTALLIVAFLIFRSLGCDDNIGELSVAMFFAVIAGYLLYQLNYNVFGRDAMNFLGLPYMVDKAKDGSPIYTCSATPYT